MYRLWLTRHIEGLVQDGSISSALPMATDQWRYHILTSNHWYIDGLVQEKRNSSALAMELRLSCTNPSIWYCLKKACNYPPASNNLIVNVYFFQFIWQDCKSMECRESSVCTYILWPHGSSKINTGHNSWPVIIAWNSNINTLRKYILE